MVFASIFNPTIELGNLHHDHSNIKSKLDLKVSEIDHWCLAGDDDSCTCDNPLIPSPRLDHKSWIVAYKGNRKKVDTYVQMNQNPDVAFVGESISKYYVFPSLLSGQIKCKQYLLYLLVASN